MFKQLAELADKLDRKGFHKEASEIDNILRMAVDMDWPQPSEQEMWEQEEDVRTHPYTEEYMGEGEEQEPYTKRDPSYEARQIAYMYRKNKLKEYIDRKFGTGIFRHMEYEMGNEGAILLGDILEMMQNPATKREDIDKLINEAVFSFRISRDECMTCGGETGSKELEKDGVPIYSPVCDNCWRKNHGLGEEEFKYLSEEEPELLENLDRFFTDIRDPSEIEEEYGPGYDDEEEYLYPEDDDYNPEEHSPDAMMQEEGKRSRMREIVREMKERER